MQQSLQNVSNHPWLMLHPLLVVSTFRRKRHCVSSLRSLSCEVVDAHLLSSLVAIHLRSLCPLSDFLGTSWAMSTNTQAQVKKTKRPSPQRLPRPSPPRVAVHRATRAKMLESSQGPSQLQMAPPRKVRMPLGSCSDELHPSTLYSSSDFQVLPSCAFFLITTVAGAAEAFA